MVISKSYLVKMSVISLIIKVMVVVMVVRMKRTITGMIFIMVITVLLIFT